MEEISLELERVVPVGAMAKKHNELEGLGFEESGHFGFASSEELNATKESLQSQIDTNANAIRALSEGIDPEKIDGIKDLIDYVEEHQVDVVSIQEGIEQNASDIDSLEGRVSELEESGSSAEPSGEPLVATFQIDSANTSVTVKNLTGATSVDWGDGTPIEDISSVTTYTHTYESVDAFVAKFYGNITSLDYSFREQTTLRSIVLPKTVNTLGAYVFFKCKNLIELDIPNSVTTLGDAVIRACTRLVRIVIPASVKTIHGGSTLSADNLKILEFLGECPTYTSVISALGSNVRVIVPYQYLSQYKTLFATFNSRVEAYTPSSVVEGIDERVTALEEGGGGGDTEELEKRVDNLELLHQDPLVASFKFTMASTANATVKNLNGATMVDWGDGTPIEDISNITEYTHSYGIAGTFEARFWGVRSIGDRAFYVQTFLRSIYIPKTIRSIGQNAFHGANGLLFVDFAYDIDLSSISNNAFSGCSNLLSINIPQNISTIGDYAFNNCSKLNNVELPTTLSVSGNGVGSYAFGGCQSLTNIVIPKTLKKISQNTFHNCTSLKQIIIPSKIAEIESNAFFGNTALEEIHLYYGSQSGIIINSGAFASCTNLKKVIFDKESIESQDYSITLKGKIFTDKGDSYSNDRILEIRSDIPPTITGIEYIQDDIKIIVPKSSLEAYKNADGWKDKASQIDCEITANDVYALVGNINTELANIIEGEGV